MLPRISQRQAPLLLRAARQRAAVTARRRMTMPPKPGAPGFLERRADRELPDFVGDTFRWSRSLPVFGVVMVLASLAIFNYQKSSSPVIEATLYALRTSPRARDILGDEIYFRRSIPWISGEMNQVKGRIDITYSVKGTRGTGVMRFTSRRPGAKAMFETLEWSLETEDGRKFDLLEEGDPFAEMRGGAAETALPDDEDDEDEKAAATRGFRQMPKR